MAATLIIFTIMAIFYKYVNFIEIENQRDEEENRVKELAKGSIDDNMHENVEKGEPYTFDMKTEKVPGIPGYVHSIPPVQMNNYTTAGGPHRKHVQSWDDNPAFVDSTNL